MSKRNIPVFKPIESGIDNKKPKAINLESKPSTKIKYAKKDKIVKIITNWILL